VTSMQVRHDRHRHGMTAGDETILDLPEAQPVIARIAAATDPDYPHRMEHVRRVATIAVKAKLAPSNSFARATL
jgi:hypothetical protein